jgi:hypothetical protein
VVPSENKTRRRAVHDAISGNFFGLRRLSHRRDGAVLTGGLALEASSG